MPDDKATPPSKDNPTLSIAEPGAAKPGVPNFFIDKFAIPPFLLPIYQAAGTEYGIRWEVLAAINEIETNYGRNLNVSSAGAEGWMQFMPATWKTWGVDANQDGYADPLNPVDAIFTAARYLKAAGADTDLRKAVFAYNHANWYVDSVLLRAQVIGGLPTNLVTSLTGLTEGRFPVAAEATYADEVTAKSLGKKARKTAAVPVASTANRRGISIYADAGSPVIAVSDSQVTRIGVTKRLGNFIQIQDAYGNTYTYGRLAKISKLYAAPKPQKVDPGEIRRQLALPSDDKAPTKAASETEAPAPKKTDTTATTAGATPARRRSTRTPRRSRRACSPTPIASTPRPPAAPSRSSCAPAGSTARSPPRRRSGSRATRSSSSTSRSAHRSPRARCSGGSARSRRPSTRTCASRSARPAAAPRGSTRSRSSTAGSCSSRPRSTARRARAC